MSSIMSTIPQHLENPMTDKSDHNRFHDENRHIRIAADVQLPLSREIAGKALDFIEATFEDGDAAEKATLAAAMIANPNGLEQLIALANAADRINNSDSVQSTRPIKMHHAP